MNIYLDIDGVLLASERTAAEGADGFLTAVLAKYPESTYWLTTHCWRGQFTAIHVLAPHLKPETVKLLEMVKKTDWDEWKTDAINFSQPFLWFDDDLYPEEKRALEAHNALNSHILLDLYKNPSQLKELTEKYFS